MANQLPVQPVTQRVDDGPNMDHGDHVSKEEIMRVAGVESTKEEGFSDSDIQLIPLKKFLDLSDSEYKADKELKYILEWGKQKGMDKQALFAELKKVQNKIGYQDNSTERVKRMYSYIKLSDQFHDTATKLSILET